MGGSTYNNLISDFKGLKSYNEAAEFLKDKYIVTYDSQENDSEETLNFGPKNIEKTNTILIGIFKTKQEVVNFAEQKGFTVKDDFFEFDDSFALYKSEEDMKKFLDNKGKNTNISMIESEKLYIELDDGSGKKEMSLTGELVLSTYF